MLRPFLTFSNTLWIVFIHTSSVINRMMTHLYTDDNTSLFVCVRKYPNWPGTQILFLFKLQKKSLHCVTMIGFRRLPLYLKPHSAKSFVIKMSCQIIKPWYLSRGSFKNSKSCITYYKQRIFFPYTLLRINLLDSKSINLL